MNREVGIYYIGGVFRTRDEAAPAPDLCQKPDNERFRSICIIASGQIEVLWRKLTFPRYRRIHLRSTKGG